MKEARTGRKGSEIISVRYKAKVDHTLNAIAKTGGIRQAGIIDMKDRTTKDESGWTRPKEVRNKTRSDYTKLMLYTYIKVNYMSLPLAGWDPIYHFAPILAAG